MWEAWSGAGLLDVEQTSLMIRMEYEAFEDFWAPIEAGEGPLGKHVTSLECTNRVALAAAVRPAYEAGHGDGRRSLRDSCVGVQGSRPNVLSPRSADTISALRPTMSGCCSSCIGSLPHPDRVCGSRSKTWQLMFLCAQTDRRE